jgi:hypothetical protein
MRFSLRTSYWIATKAEVGEACMAHHAHGTANWERRFFPKDFPAHWKDRWSLFDRFRPPSPQTCGSGGGSPHYSLTVLFQKPVSRSANSRNGS